MDWMDGWMDGWILLRSLVQLEHLAVLITESSKPPQTGLNKYNHFEDLYSQEIGPSLHLSLYCLMCIIA